MVRSLRGSSGKQEVGDAEDVSPLHEGQSPELPHNADTMHGNLATRPCLSARGLRHALTPGDLNSATVTEAGHEQGRDLS